MSQARGQPFAFVLMPFSDEWTELYEFGTKPACEAAGVQCARVDEQVFLESILERIYGEIERADLVIAEMTGRNPNVFYEAGYAHGLGKPVILLTETADDIPFDLRHHPHIVHSRRIRVIRDELERRGRWVVENPEAAVQGSPRRFVDQQRMAQHIKNYLDARGFRTVSFERVRRSINPAYSDAMLQRLIDESPTEFRRVRLRDGRVGIGLVR